MAQINSIGAGQTYTSVSAWAAAEGGADNGVGNPAIGERTGFLTEDTAIGGVFIRGFILRAKAGEEFNPETLTGVGSSGQLRPNCSTSIECIIQDLRILNGVSYFGNSINEITNCLVERPSGDAVEGSSEVVTARNIITRNCDRAFESDAPSTDRKAINCTSLGVTGSFSFVRWQFTNCFHVGGGSGFAATEAGSDYNASDDTTSPGANSLDNRTTADMVDFAGGDFRTASASALATAGKGTPDEDFIGFSLEVSSGITVTGATANYNYTGIAGTVDLTGEIIVTGGTANYDYDGISGTIDLTGEVIVTGATANYDYTGLSGTVELGAEIIVTGQTANYNYSGIDGTVELTGSIIVTGQTANYDYDGIAADIILQGSIVVTGQTANYDYNALNGTIIIQGPIAFNPKNVITVGRKQNSITVKRKSNIVRVK